MRRCLVAMTGAAIWLALLVLYVPARIGEAAGDLADLLVRAQARLRAKAAKTAKTANRFGSAARGR